MRKIISILIVLFGLSVFLTGYSSEIHRQARVSLGPFGEWHSQDHELEYDYYTLCLPVEDWNNRVPDLLKTISQEFQTCFVIHYGPASKEMREETELYVILPEDMEYPVFSVSGIPVNEETLQSVSFTSDANRARTEGFELLDFTSSAAQYSPEPIATIYPLSKIHSDLGQNTYSLEVIGKNLPAAEQALENLFSSDQLIKNETGGGVELTGDLRPEYMQEMMMVFGVGLIILAICWFFQNRREIMIRKLLGQNSSLIFTQVFLPSILGFLALFLSVIAIPYVVMVGDIRPVNQRLFSYMVTHSLWFLAGLGLCSLLIWFSIGSLNLLESIKENRGESRFSFSGFLVKTACVSLSLTALVSCLYVSYEYSRELILVQKSEPFTTNKLAVNWVYVNYGEDEAVEAEKEKLLAFCAEIPLIYQRIKPEIEAVDYAAFPYPVTPLFCNTAYLDRYPVLDTTGNPLQLSPEKEYLLIPENLSYTPIPENIDFDQAEIIEIQSGQKHYAFSAWYDAERLEATDAVIRVTRRWNPLADSDFVTGDSHYFEASDSQTLEEIEALLDEENFQKISWLKTSDSYITKIRMLKKYLMMRTGILLTILSVFAILMFYTTQLFLIDEKNKIAIQTLMGQSFFARYGQLVLSNGAVYLGCALLGICFLQTDPVLTSWLLGGCFVLDLGISAMMIHRFEKKKLAGCLKGDEI